MSTRKRILSAIQPTGNMHFGNYFGAVQNWVRLQEEYDCVYGVVDYHAMTMPYDPKKLRQNTWEILFNLMAVGVEPNNLFIQSLIPEHAELGWILNCFCSHGRLSLMTQFKDKSIQSKAKGKDDFISVGLFDYPVLQAADILIYRADLVPVGKDQDQHLELTRKIANRFNSKVKKEYFVLPETLHTQIPKVMSTVDPTKKMSKSAGEKHYISVFAEEKRIRKQINSATTDTGNIQNGDMSAGIENLFSLLKAAGKIEVHTGLMEDYHAGNLKYSDLKGEVAEGLVALSTSFKLKKEDLLTRKKEIQGQIRASSAEIRKRAQETIREVKELAGLSNIPQQKPKKREKSKTEILRQHIEEDRARFVDYKEGWDKDSLESQIINVLTLVGVKRMSIQACGDWIYDNNGGRTSKGKIGKVIDYYNKNKDIEKVLKVLHSENFAF